MKTKIEWATDVWNPVTGCTKVSEGCRHCYAETIAKRFWGERKFTDVLCHEDRLDAPLHWKKPRRVFVNSMSDLFHPDVPFEFIDMVFGTMAWMQEHTFMILTKRPDRMYDYIVNWKKGVALPNVWLGVTVENQKAADERIPLLLKTPAALRFVSIEPMLSFVNFEQYLPIAQSDIRGMVYSSMGGPFIDWVICGGETGPVARPMHPLWARSLRDQCVVANTPFFFKSWGEWSSEYPDGANLTNVKQAYGGGNVVFYRVGKKRTGRLLDGREWNDYPGVTR